MFLKREKIVIQMIIPYKIYFLIGFVLQCYLLTNTIVWDAFFLSENSDLLYPAMFVLESMNSFSSIAEWNLTPAPYFFPDLFLYSFFYFFDIGISLFIYNFIFSFTLIYYLYIIFKNIKIIKYEIYFIYYIYFLISIVFLISGKIFYFFSPTHHGSLYCFGLYLVSHRTGDKKSSVNYYLYGIGVLFGLSDILIILQVFIPILLFEIFSTFENRHQEWKKLFIYYFKLFLAILLGRVVLMILQKNHLILIPDIPFFKTFLTIIRSGLLLENIKKTFFDFFVEAKELYFYYIILSLFIGISILLSKKVLKKLPQSKNLLISFIISTLILFLFQGSFGLWIGYRYMWFYYLFPLVYLSLEIYYKLSFLTKEKSSTKFIKIFQLTIQMKSIPAICALVIFFVLSLEGIYLRESITKILSFYIQNNSSIQKNNISFLYPELSNLKLKPDLIKCMDSLQEKYDLQYGISDYWLSKYITYFSKYSIRTTQVTESLEIYNWINHPNPIAKEIGYTFIIPNNLNSSLIKERLGLPERIEKCVSKEIWIYTLTFSYSQLHTQQRERKP